MPRRHLGRPHHRGQRNLELQHDEIRRCDLGLRPIDILRREAFVGAGRHDDRVLGRSVDADERHARRRRLVAHDMAHVHALGAIARQRLFAEEVAPHARHEGHVAAQPRGRDGLIGPLAAGGHHETAAENRLARRRHPLGLHHQIGIGTADHHYFSHRFKSVWSVKSQVRPTALRQPVFRLQTPRPASTQTFVQVPQK